MARTKYQTRDPQPDNRDPQPEARPPERSFDHVPIVRVTRPACPACGGTTWRNGGTSRPNIVTGEMLRWRRCAHCGQSQYHASAMTAQERKKYGIAQTV